MRRPIYVKNSPVKFHPYSVWSDKAIGFLRVSPQEEEDDDDDEYNDMGPVTDSKIMAPINWQKTASFV